MDKHMLGTYISIMSRFDHMPYLKPTGHSFEAMIHNFSSLEKFFQLKVKLIFVESAILIVHMVANSEKT